MHLRLLAVTSTSWALSKSAKSPASPISLSYMEGRDDEAAVRVCLMHLTQFACRDKKFKWAEKMGTELSIFLQEQQTRMAGEIFKTGQRDGFKQGFKQGIKQEQHAKLVLSYIGSTADGMKTLLKTSKVKYPCANALIAAFANYPLLLSHALEAAVSQGALGADAWSGPWRGHHPLFDLAVLRMPHPALGYCMKTLSQAGYKADWSLPAGFEGSAQNPGSTTEPHFLLMWAKSNSTCLFEATQIAIEGRVDFSVRSKRGETALGALNRRARIMAHSDDAKKALELASGHGDLTELAEKKDSALLGSTPAIKSFMAAQAERRALEQGVDSELWAQCLVQAKAESEAALPKQASTSRSRL